MKLRMIFICLSCLTMTSFCLSYDDDFYESLNVKVVKNNQIYSFFNFTTTWKYENEFKPQHYRLFSRSLGQLIQKYNIAELHFTMTQGLWRYHLWGLPNAPAPTGAQVWVWFHKDTYNVDEKWVGFTNALSGLFCASLNFINKAGTVTPTFSFRPTGLVENGLADNRFLRYGSLARENLCTENLTPWMKLLPCGSKSGLGSLLNPSQLHHSHFLSIGLHFRHDCGGNNCADRFVQLQQRVSVVYDVRSLTDKSPSFSLVSMFNRKVKPACPLATSSVIKIQAPQESKITPDLIKDESGDYVLDLSTINADADIKVRWTSNPTLSVSQSNGIISHCYLTGLGLNGGLSCSITNQVNDNLTVVFFQVIPWFLYTQLHTLKIETDGGEIIEPKKLLFTPARIRHSPYILELVLTLPSSSVTTLSIQMNRGFLTWTEHPPDAHHGFYISPAVITVQTHDIGASDGFNEPVHRIYSEALLVEMPLPDFSMPYNVICLVCTVLAIAFGSFHNLTTRRFHKLSPNAVHPLAQKLVSLVNKFRQKPDAKVTDELQKSETDART